jgi:stage II sporulation protein M
MNERASNGEKPTETNGGRRPFTRRLTAGAAHAYREEWAMWKSHYRRYFAISARVLAVGFLAGFLYFTLLPGQSAKALGSVMRSLRDIPLGAAPAVLAVTIFYHNVRASVVAVAAGLVPFLCLPVLDPLLNGGVLGFLVSVSRRSGLDPTRLILTGILPHGVFEIAAVLYAASVGAYLSLSLGRGILAARRKKKGLERPEVPPAGDNAAEQESDPAGPGAARAAALALSVARAFLLVILPLLLVAAFVEAFVTPHLMKM